MTNARYEEFPGEWHKECCTCTDAFASNSLAGLLSFFSKNRSSRDGLSANCKKCQKQDVIGRTTKGLKMTHDKQSERDEIQKINDALNLKINMEIERRAHEWLEKAQGTDWTNLFEQTMRDKLALKTSLDEALAKVEELMELINPSGQGEYSPIQVAKLLRAENDRLRKSLSCVGVHTCFDGCEHPMCLMRKERDEWKDKWEKLEISRAVCCTKNQKENERLKADCAAMRDMLEGSGYKDNCACPTRAESIEHHGEFYRCPYCIIGDVLFEPNPGSDLLAELHALRDVAKANPSAAELQGEQAYIGHGSDDKPKDKK